MTDVTSQLMLCFVENIDIRYQLYPIGEKFELLGLGGSHYEIHDLKIFISNLIS